MKLSQIALEIIELLLNERKECYLREIAKKTNNSTSSISRQLILLSDLNMLIERKSGKELMYSLNTKNMSLQKLCEFIETDKLNKFFSRNKEIKIILEDFLVQVINKDIINITLFGSIAKEQYNKESDIDLLIVTCKNKDFAPEIRKIHAEYGKNISIVNITTKELKNKMSEPLIKEIIKNHLILFGYEYFMQKVMMNE